MSIATRSAIMAKDTTQGKTVTPLLRVLIEASNDIVHRVRNGKGLEYLVTIHEDGTTGCVQCVNDQPCESTKGGRKCYHIAKCLKLEEARVVVAYGDIEADGVTPDHASEKTQRYAKAADLNMTVVQYLRSLRVVAEENVPQMSPEMPTTDTVVSEECHDDKAEQWTGQTIAEEPAQVIARVHECLRELSYVCDGAREEDGMGFNGVDAEFGHELAARRELTSKQLLAAAKMLKKYNHTQLGGRVPTVAQVEKALEQKRSYAPLNGNRGFSLLRA